MCAGYEMSAVFGETYYNCLISLGLERGAPLRHYLGRLEGEPVATATMFLGAGVAGIYDVSTIPAARRRGIGAVMTVRPLQDARDRLQHRHPALFRGGARVVPPARLP